MLKTTDGGTAWIALNPGTPFETFTSVYFPDDSTGYAVTGFPSDGGIFKTIDAGDSWNLQDQGPIESLNAVFFVDTNIGYIVGDNGIILKTTNGGVQAQWIQTNLPNTDVYSLAVNGSNLFAGTYSGVFLSTNNGTSWTDVSTGLLSITSVYSLAVSGSNLFAGTNGDGVFLSTNNGTSWTAVNNGLTNLRVLSFAVNGANLFVGTEDGGVFLSTNNGTSWTAVNTGLPSTYVFALAVNGSNLFAGTLDGVFLSTNNGASWMAVNAGLTSTSVYSLAVHGSNLFAGTLDGVFLSTNNGASWMAVNTGLTSTLVYSFAVHGSNLFAGTDGRGVWRRPLSEMVTGVEDDFNQVPVGFTLEQNYPNPFWSPAWSGKISATIIRYQLPKTTQVVLKIYNIFGQEVRTLVNARQSAGVNSVVWDGRDRFGKEVSSGIYIYRLEAGESIQSRKMTFVR
jgi:photosystem II stability/assembly factor-like uncharacterized protein